MEISPTKPQRYLVAALIAIALFYALIAGLRTVGDFDLGWQMATGRYVAQHHQMPDTDVFSYTAQGKEWIYQRLPGRIFYELYLLGGYSALSWLSALACLATIAVLLRRDSALTAALAIVAVPVVVFRTAPRAEMFSTVFFAAFVAILWRQFLGERVWLWLLPVLMLVWVNLHMGFVTGLAMMGAYVMLELLEMPFAQRREPALLRLRRSAPWLAATFIATFVNPWGPGIYPAIARLMQGANALGDYVNEWMKSFVSWAAIWNDFIHWRNPDSGYWWLVATAFLAIVLSLWRRQFGVVILLAGATYFSLTHLRYQGMFVCLAVPVAGSVLAGISLPQWAQFKAPIFGSVGAGRIGLLAAMVLMVGVRSADLISNRYYLATGQISLFGPGISWWFPEGACAFLLREHLPVNVFNDYDLGGYLTWRIGPEYPVYVDGRAYPYGAQLLFHQEYMMQQPPDSSAWQIEADHYNINTIIISMARYGGLGRLMLPQFCRSQAWRPVYLDGVAAIFVRNRPENATWLSRLQIDCSKVQIGPAAGDPQAKSAGERYNDYANAGSVLYVLGRNADALQNLKAAEAIFSDDSNLHLVLGQLDQSENHLEQAEQEFRESVRLRPTDAGWYSLGRLFAGEHQFDKAAEAFKRAAEFSYAPAERYLTLAEDYVLMQRPDEALKEFEYATRIYPYPPDSPQGAGFYSRVDAGRARALLIQSMAGVDRAVELQKRAVALTPNDPARWAQLADLYRLQGHADLSEQAAQRAAELRSK